MQQRVFNRLKRVKGFYLVDTHDLIRSLMGLKGLNAQSLARRTTITSATLSRYLNGKTDIKSENLIKILAELNIDLRELLKKSLVRSFNNHSDDSFTSEFARVFCSLEQLDQKTIIQLAVSSLPSDLPAELQIASEKLSQHARNLGLRKRYA